MMDDRFSLCIGFKQKGFPVEPMDFHLLRVEFLCIFYQLIYLLIYIWLRGTVAWVEVDEPYDWTGILGKTIWHKYKHYKGE